MHKISFKFLVIFVLVTRLVECGTYGRSGAFNIYNNNGAAYQRGTYGNGNGYGYINNGRNMIMMDQNSVQNRAADDYARQVRQQSGLSAWGIITIIIVIILLAMAVYYAFLCYPLIYEQERNYDIMDAASTTASTTTPTQTSDFEKMANYSSRSTTPS